ncbi:DUF2849 domain-containing protein [Pelagibius sp. 7325]|uniref:DUF2849 domain-containing protein n=1 Tax=Pelagibius sp. 7325 TaxID=3131994 RepID=UPI0030EBD600
MSKKTDSLKIVTANRLREGDVVYLTDSGKWSIHLNESRASRDPAAIDAMLAEAAADVAARRIVAPYAMEVSEVDGILQPLSAREIIRAAGPTVRADYRQQENDARSRAA